MRGHEPNHSAFSVMFPPAGYPHSRPHVCRVGQGGHRQPFQRNLSGKKDRQLSFPAYGQKCTVIFDSVLWIARSAVSLPEEPKTKLPLGLCHLEEKNTCSALPLPACRDSPPASETARYSCSPFTADPSVEAAMLQPNDDSRGAESSSRSTQVHKTGARDLPGAGKGGPLQHFFFPLLLPARAGSSVRAGEVCQGTSRHSPSHGGRF